MARSHTFNAPVKAFYTVLLISMLAWLAFGHTTAMAEQLALQNGIQANPAIGPLRGRLQYPESNQANEYYAAPQEYRLGPGDVLTFNMLSHPELLQEEVLVRMDGKASFLYIGDVMASGKTIEGLNAELTERYARFYKRPVLTVGVARTRPGTVYLVGAVLNPGMLQMRTFQGNNFGGVQNENGARFDMRLTNVLANAGGVMLNADLAHVAIKHVDGTATQVNLWKLLEDGDARQDKWLNSGDTIIIPELPRMALDDERYTLLLRSSIAVKTFPVRVLGFVKTPGVIELKQRSPYLSSAIAGAAGYRDQAKKTVVAIRRFTTDTDFSTIVVDPNKTDLVLRENDVIYVDEHRLFTGARWMQQVAQVFAPFTSAALVTASVDNVRND